MAQDEEEEAAEGNEQQMINHNRGERERWMEMDGEKEGEKNRRGRNES